LLQDFETSHISQSERVITSLQELVDAISLQELVGAKSSTEHRNFPVVSEPLLTPPIVQVSKLKLICVNKYKNEHIRIFVDFYGNDNTAAYEVE